MLIIAYLSLSVSTFLYYSLSLFVCAYERERERGNECVVVLLI